MRQSITVKNSTGKFCIQVIENSEILYDTGYVYDTVYNLENQLSTYLQKDIFLIEQDGLFGVLDGVEQKLLIPIEYNKIEVKQLHTNIIFICTDNNENYQLFDNIGNNIFPYNHVFINIMYIGYYQSANKYLYMFDTNDGVGIFSTDGNIIIEPNPTYSYEYFREKDYLIMEKKETDDLIFYDIFLANGKLVHENVDNYEFLNI